MTTFIECSQLITIVGGNKELFKKTKNVNLKDIFVRLKPG